MSILSKLTRGRSPRLGLLSDVAMVATAAFRAARRNSDGPGPKRGALQWAFVAGAAFRILRRVRAVRRKRRAEGSG
jgi:hypothetical protein